jgi:hypothetical protein
VNREQRLNEIRKELALNSRLSQLLLDFGKDFADAALRRQYATNDAAGLIRQAGLAEGAEKFVSEITKSPSTAQSDRRE